MPDTPLSLFISYSRTDSEFVDRLEADLKARNFQPWVDRRKLEGGQDWSAELEKAIERCQLLVVVLSPEAMASKYVRREYRYADSQNKPIIPLNWRTTKVPFELNDIQWVNFEGNYDKGLADLLVALSRQALAALPASRPRSAAPPPSISDAELPVLVAPQPAAPLPAADLNQLYRAGVAAKGRNDLERTAIFWKQVLDRDPAFGNGTLAPQMQQLQAELHPLRVQRLRSQAEQAHRTGVWGQEIGAWQALLRLEPKDEQAQRRLPVAQQNQKYAWIYENAQEFAKEKDVVALKTQLELLWRDAPYYGDPAGLARLVGVKAPPSFQETMNAQNRTQAAKAEAMKKAEQASERKQQRKEFVDEVPGPPAYLLAFCLLGGVGVSVGMLTQSWAWAIQVTAALALIAYPLGYHRAMGLVAGSFILLASGALVFGVTWLFSPLQYDHPEVGHLWFNVVNTVTLRHQMIFGTILGVGITGIIVFLILFDNFADVDVPTPLFNGLLFGSPVIWLLFIALGSIFNWGFGFGYGWAISFLAGFVALVGCSGLAYVVFVCSWALKNSPDQIHRKIEGRRR
ncbi:MAG TPA: TIR domain-containing protein [Ktedonobacterales bacterium]|jgi:hypothetical protein